MRQCKSCGAEFYQGETVCPYCGTRLVTGAPFRGEEEQEPRPRWESSEDRSFFRRHRDKGDYWNSRRQQPPQESPPPLNMFRGRRRDAFLLAFLAIFLGTFGAQWFYRGKVGRGILCLLFLWTGIPTLLGVVEGLGLLRRALKDGPYLP